jgi:hypothetical protein
MTATRVSSPRELHSPALLCRVALSRPPPTFLLHRSTPPPPYPPTQPTTPTPHSPCAAPGAGARTQCGVALSRPPLWMDAT